MNPSSSTISIFFLALKMKESTFQIVKSTFNNKTKNDKSVTKIKSWCKCQSNVKFILTNCYLTPRKELLLYLQACMCCNDKYINLFDGWCALLIFNVTLILFYNFYWLINQLRVSILYLLFFIQYINLGVFVWNQKTKLNWLYKKQIYWNK